MNISELNRIVFFFLHTKNIVKNNKIAHNKTATINKSEGPNMFIYQMLQKKKKKNMQRKNFFFFFILRKKTVYNLVLLTPKLRLVHQYILKM